MLLNDASAVYVGNAKADAIFAGTTKVWPPSSAQPIYLVASFVSDVERTNFSGMVGAIFTLTKDQTFNRVGARRATGNSGIHQVEFGVWNGGVLQPVVRTGVDLSNGPVGGFNYQAVAPLALTAGTPYYLGILITDGDASGAWSETSPVTMNNAVNVASFYSANTFHGTIAYADQMYAGLDLAFF